MDRDMLALTSRHQGDRVTGGEILRIRAFIKDQRDKAAYYNRAGNPAMARDPEARAAMMEMELDKIRKTRPYRFEQEADERLLHQATNELEEALNLSPAEVEERREYLNGLCESFNASHDGEFSYVINRESLWNPERSDEVRLIKIDHPGEPARKLHELGSIAGRDTLDNLLSRGFGKESYTPDEGEKAQKDWEGTLTPYETKGE